MLFVITEMMLADAQIDAFNISTRMLLLWFGARIASSGMVISTGATGNVYECKRMIFAPTEKGNQMVNKVDIIDVMNGIRKGELKVSMQNGFFVLEDLKSGERVRLNEAYVPCKECKHYVWNAFGDGCYVCVKHGKYGFRAKDYCSYGERKDNE